MVELTEVACGLCGAQDGQLVRRVRGFRIVRCGRCGCLYTNPRGVWSYTSQQATLTERLQTYERDYWPKRRLSAEPFWSRAERFRLTGRLLEIGCGFGFLLNEARRQGWDVLGLELAEDEAAWGREQFGLEIASSLEDNRLKAGQFDIIALWDVIEHIPDVDSLLAACHSLLRPGGLLFLKTPDGRGLTLRPTWWSWTYLPLYWQLVYPANPIEHIYHFTPDVFAAFLQKHGFDVVLLETEQTWEERILVGRNRAVLWIRRGLMRVAWRARLPYEMSVWAKER